MIQRRFGRWRVDGVSAVDPPLVGQVGAHRGTSTRTLKRPDERDSSVPDEPVRLGGAKICCGSAQFRTEPRRWRRRAARIGECTVGAAHPGNRGTARRLQRRRIRITGSRLASRRRLVLPSNRVLKFRPRCRPLAFQDRRLRELRRPIGLRPRSTLQHPVAHARVNRVVGQHRTWSPAPGQHPPFDVGCDGAERAVGGSSSPRLTPSKRR